MRNRSGTTLFTVLAASIALHGCATNTSLGSADDKDRIVITTAKERAITAVSVQPSTDGSRRIQPKRVLCAEPSPDVATAVSDAVSASLKAGVENEKLGKGAVDAAFSRNVTESIAQLGSRLATIQLLRDELSDLCRAYANGAVSSITYTLRLSRLDKKMITLLVSEASAGALSRALVSINGAASAGGLPVSEEKLKAAETKVRDAAKAVTDAGTMVSDLTEKRAKATEQAEKDKLDGELVKAQKELAARLSELSDRALERLALDTRGGSMLNASSAASAIAGLQPASLTPLDLRAIHKAYLDEDDLGTLLDACLTSMEDNQLVRDPNAGGERAKLQETLKQANVAAIEASQDLSALRGRGPNQSGLTKEEAQKLDAAERRFRKADADRWAAQEALDAAQGSFDRTSLLTYCRTNMTSLARMMEIKIRNKFDLENNRMYIELCKSALTSTGVPDTAKTACIQTLLSYPSQGQK